MLIFATDMSHRLAMLTKLSPLHLAAICFAAQLCRPASAAVMAEATSMTGLYDFSSEALFADDETCHDDAVVSLLQLHAGRTAAAVAVNDSNESLGYHAAWGDRGGSRRNIKTLYHQTSYGSAMSILKHGFRLGSPKGWCGSAIYFSPCASCTDLKAVSGTGYIIEAHVDLGRVLTLGPFCDKHLNLHRLHQRGYNSITFDRGGHYECKNYPKGTQQCQEYVIYDTKQVVSMKGIPWHKRPGWFAM